VADGDTDETGERLQHGVAEAGVPARIDNLQQLQGTRDKRGRDQGLHEAIRETKGKRQAEQDKLESSKTDVGWGHQIRSYVLDQSRVKDLRTNVEMSNTRAVLDGDLDDFIGASLKQGV